MALKSEESEESEEGGVQGGRLTVHNRINE